MAGFADSKHADLALFVLAFAESSFFPIPPDVLLLALAFAKPSRALRYALICTVGSVLGGAFGYALGHTLLRAAAVKIVGQLGLSEQFAHAGILYVQYDVWAVGVAAFTVIPYKVFTILAGLFRLDFWRFMLASVIGRGGRFLIVGLAIRWFGPRLKPWVEKYLEWCSLAIVALIILGFLIIGWLAPAPIETNPEELRSRIQDLDSDDLDTRRAANLHLLEATRLFFGYNPSGPEEERREAIDKWLEWFAETYPDRPPLDDSIPEKEESG
ncbi:MAG: DedA family protein [Planctomycetota bacterium]|nr:DedA family protein [Planctomycetota bacterium]